MNHLVRYITRLVRRLIAERLSDIHTHMLAQVVSYDKTTNLCSVRPCVKRLRTEDPDNDTTVESGIIDDIPVWHHGSGKCLQSVAPQKGSYGVLHVLERSTDAWMSKGGVNDPDSVRKFSDNDGFFVPGGYPQIVDGDNGKLQGDVETDRVSLRTRTGDTQVSVLDDESAEMSNPNATITVAIDGKIAANGDEVKLMDGTDFAVQYTALKSAFDTLKTDVNNLITAYNSHIHITTATVGATAVPGVISPTVSTGISSTADMSGSKIDKVLVP